MIAELKVALEQAEEHPYEDAAAAEHDRPASAGGADGDLELPDADGGGNHLMMVLSLLPQLQLLMLMLPASGDHFAVVADERK